MRSGRRAPWAARRSGVWTACTTSAGCTALAACRSRTTSRCSTRALGETSLAVARSRDGADDDRSCSLHDRADATCRIPGVELLRALAMGRRASRRRAGDSRQRRATCPGGAAVADDADVVRTLPARRPSARAQSGDERPHPSAARTSAGTPAASNASPAPGPTQVSRQPPGRTANPSWCTRWRLLPPTCSVRLPTTRLPPTSAKATWRNRERPDTRRANGDPRAPPP